MNDSNNIDYSNYSNSTADDSIPARCITLVSLRWTKNDPLNYIFFYTHQSKIGPIFILYTYQSMMDQK